METFEGSNFLQQRLILATLSGRSITIKNIRNKGEKIGLQGDEACLIRLIEKITNGSGIDINRTGTSLTYQPGLLNGGTFEHDCDKKRSIGYYLQALVRLAPFCKKPVNATLRGVTNNQIDPSVDSVQYSTIKLMQQFISEDDPIEIRITKRGVPPKGGGEVIFTCPIVRTLKPVQLITPGKVKKIRGVAFTCNVNPANSSRIVDAAKGVLLQLLPDVFINTSHMKKPNSGESPGYGVCLYAETTTGSFYCVDKMSNPQGSTEVPIVPEDLGKEAAYLLMEEIVRGGCADSTNQSLACLFMLLGPMDVSKVKLGPLTPYTIHYLRHIYKIHGTMFKVEEEPPLKHGQIREDTGDPKYTLTCAGIGFTNISRTAN